MKIILASILSLGLVMTGTQAGAVLINFDDQGLTGPHTFADTIVRPQPLTIATSAGDVSIDGGVVLTGAVNVPADTTSVYGTSTLVGGLLNPITITFANPVSDFLVDVINGLTVPIDYRLSDDQGNSATFTLQPNASSGAETIGFAATGKTVTVTSLTAATDPFDFFIDNIRFDEPISCGPNGCAVPEPPAAAIFAIGLLGFRFVRRYGRGDLRRPRLGPDHP